MNVISALSFVNFIALCLIYVMPKNEQPLRCPFSELPPSRLLGIFSTRDIIITVIAGSLVGWLSNTNIFLAIIYEFAVGQIVHIIFRTKTMPLYKLGLSDKPDGTGRLANPIGADVNNQ
jgi:hypothetical protein